MPIEVAGWHLAGRRLLRLPGYCRHMTATPTETWSAIKVELVRFRLLIALGALTLAIILACACHLIVVGLRGSAELRACCGCHPHGHNGAARAWVWFAAQIEAVSRRQSTGQEPEAR